MAPDGKALVRLAQLRGRIAALARGGRYDIAAPLLGELTRADLALGLPADGLQRARQAAELATQRGEPIAGPMIVLAATLLAAGAPDDALDAARVALDSATPAEKLRVEAAVRLLGGAAKRRAGRLGEARLLLDAARATAARLGESSLAGFALAELAWVDLAEAQPAAAATCFEFAAEFLRRAGAPAAAIEADALAVAACAAAGEVEAAASRAPAIVDAARQLRRPEVVAYLDGVLADLAVGQARDAAVEACALAAESAQALGNTPVARDLIVQARLRQVRATDDPLDRARHIEAGIELALTLEPARAGARLGALLVGLVEDAERVQALPERGELERLAKAIENLGDGELSAMAAAVLAAV